MNKKVLTITFHRSLNFGAALQAFALAKYIKKLGYDVSVIDYIPMYFLWEIYRPAKGIRKTLDKISKLIKFTSFQKKYIPRTPSIITTRGFRNLKNIHACVCGSDQIWNPTLTGKKHDPAFFLAFAPKKSLKIAYAASTGSVRLENISPHIASCLAQFNHLGAREASLSEDLTALLPLKPNFIVADPSLLLDADDYSQLITPYFSSKKQYIFSYVVGSGEMLDLFSRRIEEIKPHFNKPIIHAGAKSIKNADHEILDLGPTEWLSLLHGADYIITNSFHGVAFAIKFEKSFTFIPHIVDNLNNRQLTLLTAAGLTRRTLSNLDKPTQEALSPINYNYHKKQIDAYIESSRKFIKLALENNHANQK